MSATAPNDNDLAKQALRRLGEIGDGQPPSPEAMRKVLDALPGILADLRSRQIYERPAFDRIDVEAIRHLSAIVASEVSDDFGVDGADVLRLASRAQAAEGKLRILRARPAAGRTARPCFF